MTIEQVPFVPYKLEEERNKDEKVISLKLSKEWQERLERCKQVLEQEKDGTAIKQLIVIAEKVLLEEKTAFLLETVFKNKRNNKRLGVITYD